MHSRLMIPKRARLVLLMGLFACAGGGVFCGRAENAAARFFLSQEEAVELFNPKLRLQESDLEVEADSASACDCEGQPEETPGLIHTVAVLRGKKPAPVEPVQQTPSPPKVQAVRKTGSKEGADGRRFKVLVLGDSLGLCGFGKSLDARLRGHASVRAVSTYMACGTIPSSWLKIGPYSAARTACGYWSIEGEPGNTPAETRDTYGMSRGHKPASHLVPKVENLLDAFQPDILVMQNGTNLLSLFSDGSTVIPTRHDAQLRAQITPFVRTVTAHATSLKKIYWVAPPVSGRYSKAIQDFLVEKLSIHGDGVWGVLDSRTLVSYPYKTPMPDKEHFIGRDMDTWAEGVYHAIAQDMETDRIPRKSLFEQRGASRAEKPQETAAAPDRRAQVEVKARLVKKSSPLRVEQILPYQESVVSCLYQVESVLSGSYEEKEILVMHPAHIRLEAQPLSSHQVGKTYSLKLIELEGSPWESIKRSDTSGRLELIPFIRCEDEARYPSATR